MSDKGTGLGALAIGAAGIAATIALTLVGVLLTNSPDSPVVALVLLSGVISLVALLILVLLPTRVAGALGEKLAPGFADLSSQLNQLEKNLFGDADAGEKMTWHHFAASITRLRREIENEYKPDIVLSIGRSGAVVGGILAGQMGGLRHIGADRISDWPEGRGQERQVAIVPSIKFLAGELANKRVLCVMSECDTGKTLETVRNDLNALEITPEFKTAVVFRDYNSHYIPNFFAVEDQGGRRALPFRIDAWPRTSKGPKRMEN